MGLDMFAWSVPVSEAVNDFEIRRNEDDEHDDLQEIFYWRKHHDLHGWFEQLYRDKGGTKESFNCVKVRLTLDDLDKLQMDLLGQNLPETTGFFFGDNPPDMESLSNDLKFLQTARDSIAAGRAVYYDSWW